MGTKETQALIVDTAIELFNRHGTRAVSTNRIADACGLSRGNLHYHFKKKQEIVQSIFRRIQIEMDQGWYDDHEHPTIDHMRFMFTRQIRLIWRYRFFYRELNSLLLNDARLRQLFMSNRRRRVKEVRAFFVALINAGRLVAPSPPVTLDSLLEISWLISDQWVPNLDMRGREVNEKTIEEGYRLILQLFQPYFTRIARREVRSAFEDAGAGRPRAPHVRFHN